MTAELPKLANDRQCLNTYRSARQRSTFPVSERPPELLDLALRFSPPTVELMEWMWRYDKCRPCITGLYNLRCISTLRRNVIDGTPSPWTLVSTSWPREVIDTALSRSAACPLVIHHLPREASGGTDFISISRRVILIGRAGSLMSSPCQCKLHRHSHLLSWRP